MSAHQHFSTSDFRYLLMASWLADKLTG